MSLAFAFNVLRDIDIVSLIHVYFSTIPSLHSCQLQRQWQKLPPRIGKRAPVQLGAKVRFQPPLSDLYHPTDHHGGILVSAKRSV
jgi:hypothetical protein